MATRMLLKTDPKLALKFLRNPSLAQPQFAVPILLTKTVNEALNQKPQLCDFLGMSQKLVTEEASFINVRESFNGCAVTSAAARGRGPSRQRIDSEDEEDEENVSEDDEFEDFDEEMGGDDDDDFKSEDDDDDDDDDDKKLKRKK